MARDGEILNKSLLQKVADYLNIGGVRRFPGQLNTDQVQMVYDLSPKAEVATPDGGEGEFFINIYSPINAPMGNEIAGETEAVFRLITGDGATAWRVDTLCVELIFDAAGLTAYDGETIDLELYYRYQGGDPGEHRILKENLLWYVQELTADTQYQRTYDWSLHGGVTSEYFVGANGNARIWNGRVPPHVGEFGDGPLDLMLRFRNKGGPNPSGAFPANTTANAYITGRKGLNGIMPIAP